MEMQLGELKLETFGSIMIEMEDIARFGWKNFIRMRINYILEMDNDNRDSYMNNILNLKEL